MLLKIPFQIYTRGSEFYVGNRSSAALNPLFILDDIRTWYYCVRITMVPFDALNFKF